MSLSIFRKAPKYWERRGPTSLLLWPLSWLYGVVLRIRKLVHDLDFSRSHPAPVPIIIVGNIRVGGTGKTPIVIALAQQLSQLGWKPAIISRGYGSTPLPSPVEVTSDSDPFIVGDEPTLMAKKTHNQFPIWVFPKRQQSIRALLQKTPDVDVIISDDGLQHQELVRWPAREGGRDIEFVVRDNRGEGNRFLLPAGPLREPSTRERDATLITGGNQKNPKNNMSEDYFLGRRCFHLAHQLGRPYQLVDSSKTQSLLEIAEHVLPKNIALVAGLGNPRRFFSDLEKHGVIGKHYPLPDHVVYSPEFFATIKAQCILITEKDAVKCSGIEDERIWVVPLSLTLPESLMAWLQSVLQRPDPRLYNL